MTEHSKFLFKSRKNHLYIWNGVLKVIFKSIIEIYQPLSPQINLIKNLKTIIRKKENYECTSHIYPVRNTA